MFEEKLMFYEFYCFQNALLPAGYRQRDQTKKSPTGTFQRENLLAHLEKQAKEHPDRDDLVPYTGEKRGEKRLTFRTMGTFDPLKFLCFH